MVAYFLVLRTMRVTWKGRKRKRERQAVLEQELALCSVLKSVVFLWGLVPSGTLNPQSSLLDSCLQSVTCVKTTCCLLVTPNKSPRFEKACFRCWNRRVWGAHMQPMCGWRLGLFPCPWGGSITVGFKVLRPAVHIHTW